MIGYISGKFLTAEEGSIIVDVNGVGYSLLVPSKVSATLTTGQPIELYVHTNVREDALDLFGFLTIWEKRVFQTLISVNGVGPRTAISILGGLEPETVLSAIVREDRATLTSVSGIGKKIAERMIIELGEKARKLLSERPNKGASPMAAAPLPVAPAAAGKRKRASTADVPPQGASASPELSGLDIADLWNEAIAALVNLGYREGDAISAIKVASNKASESGQSVSLEKLIMSSLQLLSRGL